MNKYQSKYTGQEIDSILTNVNDGKLTPYIGDNNNWWINGEDTGVCAIGSVEIDDTPTDGSTGIVTSGGVKSYVDTEIQEVTTSLLTKAEAIIFNTTIPVEGWSEEAPYTIEVTIEGILPTDRPHISPIYTGNLEEDLVLQEEYSKLDNATTDTNVLRFVAFKEVPQIEIPIQVEVVRGGVN